MSTALQLLHWIAALIVLAEALNKLERTAPFAPGLRLHDRFVDGLKALAWVLLALGAGGWLVTPVFLWFGAATGPGLLIRLDEPTLADAAGMVGFAVLIVRTRVKEG